MKPMKAESVMNTLPENTARFVFPFHFPHPDISMDLDSEGYGRVRLGYDVSFEGVEEGRNEIELEIMH